MKKSTTTRGGSKRGKFKKGKTKRGQSHSQKGRVPKRRKNP